MRNGPRRRFGLAAAALALGLAGGTAATTSLALAAHEARDAALTLRATSVRESLDTTLSRYADTLHDLASAPPADSADLARVVGDRLGGTHQVQIVNVKGEVIAEYAADGTTPLPSTRLDPDPALTAAMNTAREQGLLTATPAHQLPADRGLPPQSRQSSFEFANPTYRNGTFGGWVIVSLRAGDLLRASMTSGGVAGVATTLTETTADGVVHPVATWRQGAKPSGPVRKIALAGSIWQAEVRPTTPLIPVGREWAAPLAMIGSAVLSLGLAALVLAGSRDGRRGGVEVAEARAEAAQARAVAAERSLREREAELSGFAATAGEHLYTPLHTVAGFTEVLLEDTGPALDEESREFLRRIDAATRRMINLVEELGTYANSAEHALKVEPVELSMLTLDVAAGHLAPARQSGERPSIEVGELPAISADAVLVRRVLAHLVGNAVRYVRDGAPAQITIGAVELPGGWWRIEVADRGIGVPEELRERVFAPFYRAPSAESYPGKGLGLAVAARIVALHGGEIGLRPNPGGGSVFWFTAPAATITNRALAAL